VNEDEPRLLDFEPMFSKEGPRLSMHAQVQGSQNRDFTYKL